MRQLVIEGDPVQIDRALTAAHAALATRPGAYPREVRRQVDDILAQIRSQYVRPNHAEYLRTTPIQEWT